LIARDGTVRVFPLPTAPFRVAVLDGGERIAVLRFECDELELYDRKGALIQSVPLPSRAMGWLQVRDGGRGLLLGCASTLLWYRMEDGKAVETRRMGFEGAITCVSANDGSERVAIGFQGGDVALVDPMRKGDAALLWRVLASPDDGVRVALSPDGSRVASTGKGPLVRILDASDGEQVLALGGHGDTIISIVYSPDGNTLATGSIDGTIRLWRAAPDGALFPQWD